VHHKYETSAVDNKRQQLKHSSEVKVSLINLCGIEVYVWLTSWRISYRSEAILGK